MRIFHRRKENKYPMPSKTEGGKWIMTAKVYGEICATIGCRRPEWGGILGSSDGVHIDHYYFDKTARRTGGSYTMDTEALNRVIHGWNDRDVKLIGIIHSHPRGVTKPSQGDMLTAQHIIETIHVDGEFFTPIVQVSPALDGTITIYPYTFTQKVVMKEENLVIEREEPDSRPGEQRFSRIADILPPHVMGKKTIVSVGCGGARDFLLNMARNGVGNFILFDKDTVIDANIATQGVYLSEIGKSKTQVIKNRILDINPGAKVLCIDRFLDDEMSDEEFAEICGLSRRKTCDVLLCGCTDRAEAQLRCELLARKFAIPYLSAQIYAGGKGHEITFTYPELTKACSMCMLMSRYRKIFSSHQDTGGSSAGTSVWVTNYLNTIKEALALMMLCYQDEDTLYHNKLKEFEHQNYWMTRCGNDFNTPVFSAFDELCRAEADLGLPFGTASIQQHREADCPVCADPRRDIRITREDTRQKAAEIMNAFEEG